MVRKPNKVKGTLHEAQFCCSHTNESQLLHTAQPNLQPCKGFTKDLLRFTTDAQKVKLQNFKNYLESWKRTTMGKTIEGIKSSCIAVAKQGGMCVTYRLNTLKFKTSMSPAERALLHKANKAFAKEIQSCMAQFGLSTKLDGDVHSKIITISWEQLYFKSV